MNEQRQQRLFSSPTTEPAPWELAAEGDRLAAELVFDRPVETVFHYLVPDSLRDMLVPGQRVQAPFGKGNGMTVGFCVGVGPPPATKRRLKSIDSLIDQEPLLSANMLHLTRWIADHYLCSWGQVLNGVVPAAVKNHAGTRLIRFFEAAPNVGQRLEGISLPAKQRAVLEALCAAGRPMPVEELVEAADCGPAPLRSLQEKGLIQAIRGRTSTFVPETGAVETVTDPVLNADQQRALDAILATLRAGEHRTVLLHGVTGSGKTEVYIRAVREVVSYGRQAIVLVPEISLTPQTIRRFRSRFSAVAVLHSHLTDAERHWHWQQIARGAVQVVVGARSAVFAPTRHLGLIVIDEEHETTFKQETTPRYHAREVARQRAMLEKVPLVLGSATPTLESWLRAQRNEDSLVSLPKRVERLPLPPVVVVDIRNDLRITHGAAIGRAMESAMRRALSDGGQIILFLNLRGYFPTIWCRGCGTAVKCPHCDISLTWHKDRNVAQCHSCDYETKPPTSCPGCGRGGVRYFGIGTQRLEEEVRRKFPGATVLRMDSDSMRRRGSHDRALDAFGKGEVQILLGTQMIAKGLDFPNVTLVGVVDADTQLHQPDLRAAERTFQLISQVAGRTGRGLKGGRVLVQSSSPAEPAIVKAAAHDYAGFAKKELEHRREMCAPPFFRLMRVVFRGPRERDVKDQAKRMAAIFGETAEKAGLPVRILGPAPAPIARLKGRFRYHFQLSAAEVESLQTLWRLALGQLPQSGDVEYVVDVDPLDLR